MWVGPLRLICLFVFWRFCHLFQSVYLSLCLSVNPSTSPQVLKFKAPPPPKKVLNNSMLYHQWVSVYFPILNTPDTPYPRWWLILHNQCTYWLFIILRGQNTRKSFLQPLYELRGCKRLSSCQKLPVYPFRALWCDWSMWSSIVI